MVSAICFVFLCGAKNSVRGRPGCASGIPGSDGAGWKRASAEDWVGEGAWADGLAFGGIGRLDALPSGGIVAGSLTGEDAPSVAQPVSAPSAPRANKPIRVRRSTTRG